ncbi:MAG: hypothetical protein JO112_20020 [Planctomycetes bacterium]|nr:hypothetical protein [Planctomycetota bacterium]
MSDKVVVFCDLIRADEPTINGRIYPKELMERFVRECNDLGEVYVTGEFKGASLQLSDVIGRATEFRMSASGTIGATLEMLPVSSFKEISTESLKKLLDRSNFSPMVISQTPIERDEKGREVIKDAKIAYFALTPKDTW